MFQHFNGIDILYTYFYQNKYLLYYVSVIVNVICKKTREHAVLELTSIEVKTYQTMHICS